MKVLTGQEFAALVDKAGLTARQVSAAVECSHVTVYNYLNGADPGRSKFILWAFAHFMRESLHYNLLPMRDIDRNNARKALCRMFQDWLVEHIEFELKEPRPGRIMSPLTMGAGEMLLDAVSEDIKL